jgi:hypothetical protein
MALALACLWPAFTTPAVAGTGGSAGSSSQRTAETGRVTAIVTVLEGTVRMAGVDVELRSLDRDIVLAKTDTDGAGQVTFPGVPPGRYVIQATKPGFEATASSPFEVRAGETAQVLVDLQLTFVAPSVEVRAPTSPTQSVQPVASSDMLSGAILDVAPL